MTTQKQIEANRANAKKSTGPKSQQGKARSRYNSWTHGLASRKLIAPGEWFEDFDELQTKLIDEYAPRSTVEIELIQRLAGILWRLRRIPMFEIALIDARNAEVWEGSPSEVWEDEAGDVSRAWKNSVRYGLLLSRDAASGDAFGKLSRYETSLMRALEQTLKLISEVKEGGIGRDNLSVTIKTPLN